MNIKEELKEFGLDETNLEEGLDNFLIVFNRKSDNMRYIMSEMMKNPSIRNGIIDGTITVKLSKNDYTVITRKL